MASSNLPIQLELNQFSAFQLLMLRFPRYIKVSEGTAKFCNMRIVRNPEGLNLQQKMYLLSLEVVGLASILLGLRDIAYRGDWISGAFEITAFVITLALFYFFKKVNLNILTGIFVSE